MLLQEPAHLAHIFGSAHKGRCHKIKAGFNAEEQILLVRFTEEGQCQMHTRYIDTLAVGNPAAALDCGVDLPLVGDIIHRQFDQTIVDQHPAARTQIPAQSAIGDVGAFLCTRHLFRCQDKVRARLQHDCTVFKHTQPDLRALGVQHGADGEAEFLPQAIHNAELFQMFLMGAMGEIEPGHIHTRFHHTPESCLIGTGWPQRTDNLCLAHQTIHHTFLYAAVAVLFSLYRSSLEIATENAPGLQNPQSFYRVPFPAHFTASFSFPFWSPGVFGPLSLDKRSRLYYAYCISYISTLSTDAGTVLLLL